jgi:hypothetical protein
MSGSVPDRTSAAKKIFPLTSTEDFQMSGLDRNIRRILILGGERRTF